MMHLAVLGSTRGTNLNALVEAIDKEDLAASIELVISDKANAAILAKAAHFGIKSVFANPKGLNRQEFDSYLSTILSQHRVDFIVLIGYMRILSLQFVLHWENKIINVHPSLLPAYAGLRDLEVHAAVLQAAEMETGCTVHFVTEQVDAGPIIIQKKCPVQANDTPEFLKIRVQELEGKALVEAIQKLNIKEERA
jgi:phosphoribosylglycinamide formyltransferase 1